MIQLASLLLGALGASSALQPSSTLVVSGEAIPLAQPLVTLDYSPSFVAATGLERLSRHSSFLEASSTSLITSRLSTARGGDVTSTGVVGVLLFANDVVQPGTLSESELMGISLIRSWNGLMVHEYYESGALGLVEVPALSAVLDGPISSGLLRMLHFGATGRSGMPQRSDIYSLGVDGTAYQFGNGQNRDLYLAVLSDPHRSNGAYTTGIADAQIMEAILGVPGAFFTCESDPACVDNSPGNCWVTIGDDKGDCVSLEDDPGPCMFRGMIQGGYSLPLPLEKAWDVRDTFLTQSETGRQYVTYFYMLSAIDGVFQPSDTPLMDVLMPGAENAMNVLLYGQDQDVVIPQTTADAAIDYINVLRSRTSNRLLQAAINRAELDIMIYTGMQRSDFVTAFAGQ